MAAYEPTSPYPPEQFAVLAVKVPVKGLKSRLAVVVIFDNVAPDPEHGEVVDPIAPQRAAVLTERCSKL